PLLTQWVTKSNRQGAPRQLGRSRLDNNQPLLDLLKSVLVSPDSAAGPARPRSPPQCTHYVPREAQPPRTPPSSHGGGGRISAGGAGRPANPRQFAEPPPGPATPGEAAAAAATPAAAASAAPFTQAKPAHRPAARAAAPAEAARRDEREQDVRVCGLLRVRGTLIALVEGGGGDGGSGRGDDGSGGGGTSGSGSSSGGAEGIWRSFVSSAEVRQRWPEAYMNYLERHVVFEDAAGVL
ncbi:unnamed protein product, partial [Phaeothamnion confervicola]